MATLDLDDVEIYYEDEGKGEPLVLIPGFASGAWSWKWQTEELSANFRTIAFDTRGVSRSVLNEGAKVSIARIADDIVGMLAVLDIPSAHVLGISFGGFVAQEFALRYPRHLKKLVLASTSFGGPYHVAPSMEVLASFASTEAMNTADRIQRHLTQAFSVEFVRDNANVVETFCRLRESNAVPEQVYMQQLQSAMAFNTEARVSEITAETLVVTGDRDTVVPEQNSYNLAEKIPNARLEILSGAGHMAFVERAAEFNRIVRDFLIG